MLRKNGGGAKVISNKEAKAKIMEYARTHEYYVYVPGLYLRDGDEGLVYICAERWGDSIWVFYFDGKGNYGEAINFDNNGAGSVIHMSVRGINTIIRDWPN